MNALRDMICIYVMSQSAGMTFRLSTFLGYSNGGYIGECTARYHVHGCNVDFRRNDS